MPGAGSEAVDASPHSSPGVTPGLQAAGATNISGPEANRSPTPIDLPLTAYSSIASLALRAEELVPGETPVGERPFVGFDSERSAYARLRLELLSRAEGRYVVLVGDELEGPVDTFEEALRVGWHRFGLGPLYVKQIVAEAPDGETSSRS